MSLGIETTVAAAARLRGGAVGGDDSLHHHTLSSDTILITIHLIDMTKEDACPGGFCTRAGFDNSPKLIMRAFAVDRAPDFMRCSRLHQVAAQ